MEEVLVIVGLCIFYKNYKIILLFKGKKKNNNKDDRIYKRCVL